MIDFHSHVLPGMDDGSKDCCTSKQMLEMSVDQGCTYMIATPHFYAQNDTVERFLDRRQESYALLMREKPSRMPEIRLGAEVAFFRGISRAKRLHDLTIENSGYLLLEMPFSEWTERDIEEVKELTENPYFHVILAHLERFQLIPQNKKMIGKLIELPLTVQVNAGSLIGWKRRGKTLKLLKQSDVCILGSDCHGVHHRAPNLQEGREVVEKKLGKEFLQKIDDTGDEILRRIDKERLT